MIDSTRGASRDDQGAGASSGTALARARVVTVDAISSVAISSARARAQTRRRARAPTRARGRPRRGGRAQRPTRPRRRARGATRPRRRRARPTRSGGPSRPEGGRKYRRFRNVQCLRGGSRNAPQLPPVEQDSGVVWSTTTVSEPPLDTTVSRGRETRADLVTMARRASDPRQATTTRATGVCTTACNPHSPTVAARATEAHSRVLVFVPTKPKKHHTWSESRNEKISDDISKSCTIASPSTAPPATRRPSAESET